ncbi:hypothetical protein [Coleofasciculus sp. FACHB-SPT9]|uniref:hypothetical protein n=1 Tax=Cyanophyceae TaxID=3028117 RepID=UPI0016844F44|nr:hypothetical protein [Coleofasciculus sp. FACHB-SPT9]MBD1892962.1 hypothetical protein [Coleofasciculus sp. FACHB-SPT9]
MFFNQLFHKYYEQVTNTLLPEYKKKIGKFYIGKIKVDLDIIDNSNFDLARQEAEILIQSCQARHSITFKPLILPEDHLMERIKVELESEWVGFFKTLKIMIDNHDFYKAIESLFKRYYDGIVNSVEKLAQDVNLIADVQAAYTEAYKLGQSKEKLVQNIIFTSNKFTHIFNVFYSSIDTLRNAIGNYNMQTLASIKELKDKLINQVEDLISQEQSIQSEYEKFFLGYRLLIAQRIDPICDTLKTFAFRGQQLRSDFIDHLVRQESDRPDESRNLQRDLDERFGQLLSELEQMLAVERAEKEARQTIRKLGESTSFAFFQEVAEETQQLALRKIGDSIRQLTSLPEMLQQIQLISQSYQAKFQELSALEERYLALRQQAVSKITGVTKFSINSLNLTSDKIKSLFTPESSYKLIFSKFSSYDTDANHAALEQLATDGTFLSIGELGDPIQEAIESDRKLLHKEVIAELSQQTSNLGVGNMVGFTPVLVDEAERFDVPAFLFFCVDAEKTRPEIVCLLEVTQEGRLIHIKKLIGVLPLSSQVLNDLLENYKSIFRSHSREVTGLISDQFLANKLKLDFQGYIAQSMARAKQELRRAYLDDLKQHIINSTENDSFNKLLFVKSVDDLILRTLDNLLGFGKSDEPQLW